MCYKHFRIKEKNMASKKERLDILLVEKGICESREKAKTNIMAGLIRQAKKLKLMLI